MATFSGDLIKLNGKSYKCITSYKIQRNKLWSSDTGRNMAGVMKGTLIGNYPKIQLQIEPQLSALEMKELALLFDAGSISVEYYNNKYGCTCTADFYANDYDEEIDLRLLPDLHFKDFSVNLIPIEGEDRHVKNI